jgi:hypothetical protein
MKKSIAFPNRYACSLLFCGTLGMVFACGEAPKTDVEVGEAMVTLATIPSDVNCVRILVASTVRDVAHDLDVKAGDTISESLTGLPIGAVTFAANAYAAACSSVTKATVPTWVSEEKTVNLVPGKSSSISLTLLRNGRAKVTVEFEDITAPDAGAKH